MPNFQTLALGILACLAGASFLLPNRMSPLIRAAMGVSYVLLGALALGANLIQIGAAERETLINILTLAMVLPVLVANTGAFVVERIRRRTIKRLDLDFGRRKDDRD